MPTNPCSGALADHAHDLSDHLGDDHDLALLRETVQRRRAAFPTPATSVICSSRSTSAEASSSSPPSPSAERIYADKPKRFTKRLEKRWEAWREREPVGGASSVTRRDVCLVILC